MIQNTLHLRAPKNCCRVSLICSMEPITKNSNGIKTKNKNRDAQKKWSSHKVREVCAEAGRQSLWKR